MSELARQPTPRFERPGAFTPGDKRKAEGKTQPELPKTPDNLPEGYPGFLTLTDAWGDTVYVPILLVEHEWGSSYGETQYTVPVRGVAVTTNGQVYSENYSSPREATVRVNDRHSTGLAGIIPGHPYLP